MNRFPAILLIWFGCALAWMVLGTSLVARTGQTSAALNREVHLLWGPPMTQKRPSAERRVPREVVERKTETDEQNRPRRVEVRKTVEDRVALALAASDLDVKLDLEHRRKGLLWFPTYGVDFAGRYSWSNPEDVPREVVLSFPVSSSNVLYDGFKVSGPDGRPREVRFSGDRAEWSDTFAPGERRTYEVRYRSRGTARWTYELTEATGEVKDFRLALAADFAQVDFPPGSIAPSTHAAAGGGWRGEWRFESLVANAPIGVVLPERLNPGPLAARITFFAPVGLLFFFFVVAILTTHDRRPLHPMNYLFFGMAFFAFHLLFAYLVDHLAVVPSFLAAAATSVALVVTYARLFTGWGYALRRIGAAQLIYLVLFSTTFFWKGYTGLAITVGAIVTLFVMMQVTGRTAWSRAGAPAGEPARA
jgi:hypothetical protein